MADSQEAISPSSLLRIPQELLLQILVLLPLDDQINVIKVCSTFHNLILHDPILRGTRYAINSGAIRVLRSLNRLQNSHLLGPSTHKVLGARPVHPFSNLICTSIGDKITRYAYISCYGGEPQRGTITGRIYTDPETQEEIEAERDTVVIALTLGIYRFKIHDITNYPILDEPYLQPSVEEMTSIGSQEAIHASSSEGDYVIVQCQVVVHRNLFLKETPDPPDWVERMKLTRSTTVRELTAALLKIAFQKLMATGLEHDSTAENVIQFRSDRGKTEWVFTLIHNRTSQETRNMVWEPEVNQLGEYRVSRRVV
ncbi:hypothetical protein TWF225_011018 [Orbilia oligospora]|uniref:Uncharacterized protein n=1 Tax=Orbilia oligospora TaxID=2813651 RepID=A0A7C8P926_ORBOL|nr:hypothetical protein TWF751_009781 [Orbilia oligospora]KAF3193180.1 hypothetical protein TWF225_011018 [Orbilia oligospora]KAF3246528.1 hypothetical protein TWF217_009871 [Orbilia oligospora]KAF3271645.1 hypothetical protein TWF128_000209 [Orbilia oligospora]TGJ72595.1 hypothetical protein EYR41_004478 [Orbilia oligospora]